MGVLQNWKRLITSSPLNYESQQNFRIIKYFWPLSFMLLVGISKLSLPKSEY